MVKLLKDKKPMVKVKLFTPFSEIRCSIQYSGRMGFTWAAIQYLELRKKGSIAIGQNQDDPKDSNLYMYVYDKIVENSFRINSTGDYVYLNAKSFFIYLGYDYINDSIFFNIIPLYDVEGGKLYKLEKWVSERARRY
jgi:hypothetical protein